MCVPCICLAPIIMHQTVHPHSLARYMELDKGGKGPSAKALDSYREKYRVRRLADGRLQLRSSKGEWFLCRLDMEVPGAMLLRDNKGQVYALQTEALQQVCVEGEGRGMDMPAGWLSCPLPPQSWQSGLLGCSQSKHSNTLHTACMPHPPTQIDLSDDLVVLMMFADGDWEQQMSPVEFSDESGKVQQLKLEEKEFREVRRFSMC